MSKKIEYDEPDPFSIAAEMLNFLQIEKGLHREDTGDICLLAALIIIGEVRAMQDLSDVDLLRRIIARRLKAISMQLFDYYHAYKRAYPGNICHKCHGIKDETSTDV